MNNIDIFYNSEIILRRKSFKIKYYIISMFILIISLLIFVSCFKYYPYINLKATLQIENNNYYLRTLVQPEQINDINQSTLIINGNKYKYEVKNISDEYVLDEKYNKYYEVLLESKMDSNLVINNNIIDINIQKPQTTFLKQIIKKIKKGIR